MMLALLLIIHKKKIKLERVDGVDGAGWLTC